MSWFTKREDIMRLRAQIRIQQAELDTLSAQVQALREAHLDSFGRYETKFAKQQAAIEKLQGVHGR